MPTILPKKLRKGLLAFVPLLLISNAKFDHNAIVGHPEIFNYELYCGTKFERGTETTYDGTKFSILQLHIEDQNITPEHSVEFIISKEKELGDIGPGIYQVAKDKDGLLNYIDGVFGFLDGNDSGGLPFFAHFGEITISQLDEEAVNGSMNVYFKNAVGASIHVQGYFAGRP
jgi:hypothetical protein